MLLCQLPYLREQLLVGQSNDQRLAAWACMEHQQPTQRINPSQPSLQGLLGLQICPLHFQPMLFAQLTPAEVICLLSDHFLLPSAEQGHFPCTPLCRHRHAAHVCAKMLVFLSKTWSYRNAACFQECERTAVSTQSALPRYTGKLFIAYVQPCFLLFFPPWWSAFHFSAIEIHVPPEPTCSCPCIS